MKRTETKPVRVGGLVIGGGAPVVVQSMLSAGAQDIEGNVRQAKALEAAGCEMIRVAVPDREAVRLIPTLKNAVSMPVVADIHFDYRLALLAVSAGADKIRLNPGNIGGADRVREVAAACSRKGVPIRIGVNSGSVERELLQKFGGPTAQALVESAAGHAKLLEDAGFTDLVISLKSSDVRTTLDSYRLAAERFRYPLHLGVTEAGTERMGLIKSAIGIGSLLADGIGDTIRVSLTADPVKEIEAARDILKAAGIGGGPVVISCPTCGRTRIDVICLAGEVERRLRDYKKDIKVAVMGCAVNGPGEAREADIGIAGGDGCGLLFEKGEIVAKYPENELLDRLMERIEGTE